MENKQGLVILIAIILVIGVSGFILKASIVGQYTFAGGNARTGFNNVMIQYSYPEEACEYIPCAEGHAIFIETAGGISPWDRFSQVVRCYCPENPEVVLTVPMVHSIPSGGGYIVN